MQLAGNVILDNWSLESVSKIVTRNYSTHDLKDKFTCLLHFLDLVLIKENILYDVSYSDAWKAHGALRALAGILQPYGMAAEQRDWLESHEIVADDEQGGLMARRRSRAGIVEDGINFYL